MKPRGIAVELTDVGLAYDEGAERLVACRDLSFCIAPGEAVALIGPSGCGKSTTLHMVAGLLAPSDGTVSVGGQPIEKPRQETAFIPQDLGLFPWKTVLQNASLGLRLHGAPKGDAETRARAALSRVGLDGFERSFPKELSGGMRQRLALARALAMHANLLLMDEPLSAIDALLRESLQDTLLELWRTRRHTQMLVTHSIEEAVYLGQRILVFSDRPGTVIAQIANPEMGDEAWRDSPEFAERCSEVRTALASTTAARGGSPDGSDRHAGSNAHEGSDDEAGTPGLAGEPVAPDGDVADDEEAAV